MSFYYQRRRRRRGDRLASIREFGEEDKFEITSSDETHCAAGNLGSHNNYRRTRNYILCPPWQPVVVVVIVVVVVVSSPSSSPRIVFCASACNSNGICNYMACDVLTLIMRRDPPFMPKVPTVVPSPRILPRRSRSCHFVLARSAFSRSLLGGF